MRKRVDGREGDGSQSGREEQGVGETERTSRWVRGENEGEEDGEQRGRGNGEKERE